MHPRICRFFKSLLVGKARRKGVSLLEASTRQQTEEESGAFGTGCGGLIHWQCHWLHSYYVAARYGYEYFVAWSLSWIWQCSSSTCSMLYVQYLVTKFIKIPSCRFRLISSHGTRWLCCKLSHIIVPLIVFCYWLTRGWKKWKKTPGILFYLRHY